MSNVVRAFSAKGLPVRTIMLGVALLLVAGSAQNAVPSPPSPTVMAHPPEEAGSVWGVFVESTGHRFVARVFGEQNEEFMLVPGGRVTRNEQSAHINDLRSGDLMMIHLVRPADRWVARIQATSQGKRGPSPTPVFDRVATR